MAIGGGGCDEECGEEAGQQSAQKLQQWEEDAQERRGDAFRETGVSALTTLRSWHGTRTASKRGMSADSEQRALCALDASGIAFFGEPLFPQQRH
jgi:hypothetical protein